VLEPPSRSLPGTHPLPTPAPTTPPRPSHFPTSYRGSPRSAGGKDVTSASLGKGALFLLALALASLKSCEGCQGRTVRSPSTPRAPVTLPPRNNQPLTAPERRRLEQLRRDHLNGEPLSADERRELLDLERRARASNPGGR
jgi:hypothetical protein